MIEFHITDPTEIERLTGEFAKSGRLELLWFVAECDWRREPGRLTGVKFKDMDLLGLPLRVVVGPKTLAAGQAEVRRRRTRELALVDLNRVLPYVKDLIGQELHD